MYNDQAYKSETLRSRSCLSNITRAPLFVKAITKENKEKRLPKHPLYRIKDTTIKPHNYENINDNS